MSQARAVVLFRRGPRSHDARPLGAQEAVAEHIAYLSGLHREGAVERAGPFYGLDERVECDLVGLVVHAGGVEDARERAERDPAVRAGVFAYDAFAWRA